MSRRVRSFLKCERSSIWFLSKFSLFLYSLNSCSPKGGRIQVPILHDYPVTRRGDLGMCMEVGPGSANEWVTVTLALGLGRKDILRTQANRVFISTVWTMRSAVRKPTRRRPPCLHRPRCLPGTERTGTARRPHCPSLFLGTLMSSIDPTPLRPSSRLQHCHLLTPD